MLAAVNRRLSWYRVRFQVNNPVVGRAVELAGNRVRMDGLKYSVASPNITRGHKSTLAFGLHEMEERQLIKRWLPRDLPAIELGGGLGVVSCLTNKLLQTDQHIVVEANPWMVPVLIQNRDLNGCKFKIVNKAIAYDCETVDLPIDAEFVGSNLAGVGAAAETALVDASTVADLVNGWQSFSLIADIEGAEEDIIMREMPELGVRFAMIEFHPYVYGQDKADELMRQMESYGFKQLERLGEGDVFSVAYSR